jgi:septum formation protein
MEILLGSKSPRRQALLNDAGIKFTSVNIESDEDFHESMNPELVAEYLAVKKSNAYLENLVDQVLLTADTVVFLENKIINKPENTADAVRMLTKLSGKMHTVYTGVCLRTNSQLISFTNKTNVYFKAISSEEINYYVKNFKPLDKAGAYGIQDWIGYIGISKIDGDFFNVMGLPINLVYDQLKKLNAIRFV